MALVKLKPHPATNGSMFSRSSGDIIFWRSSHITRELEMKNRILNRIWNKDNKLKKET